MWPCSPLGHTIEAASDLVMLLGPVLEARPLCPGSPRPPKILVNWENSWPGVFPIYLYFSTECFKAQPISKVLPGTCSVPRKTHAMTPCWYVLGLHVQEDAHTEKAHEYGLESLAFEWGHDLRISQQGEKSYVPCFTLRPPP